MIDSDVLHKNIAALQNRNSRLADELLKQPAGTAYTGYTVSKNGLKIPILANGFPTNSLYNPDKEAALQISEIADKAFVFFAGIGAGFHIELFLRQHPQSNCIIFENTLSDYYSVCTLIDLSFILGNSRVTVLTIRDCSNPDCLAHLYVPSIDGDFHVVYLRPWKEYYRDVVPKLESYITKALKSISADYSVQAHFGKIWYRNIVRNLKNASVSQSAFPEPDTDTQAVVIAAGPSLEEALPLLHAQRANITVFSTDTAYPVLFHSGILPDYLVSIDAQSVSAMHIACGLSSAVTVILDLCANPVIGDYAVHAGCKVIFAANSHPLAQYAARTLGLPGINSGAGTVTFSAIDAAYSMGFTSVHCIGADFAYRKGKAYSRGTYFDEKLLGSSYRLFTDETFWTTLLFRSEVSRIPEDGSITYTTELLRRYADSCRSYRLDSRWSTNDFHRFNFSSFLQNYIHELKKALLCEHDKMDFPVSLLPLLAWYTKKEKSRDQQHEMQTVINLALDLIEGYTEVL
jgi:hypothetical protein